MTRIEFSDPEALKAKLQSDARTAVSAADMMAAAELAAPTDILVTLYDKVYGTRGEVGDYISLQAALPRHLVPTGELRLKGEDPLAPAVLLCHEEVVPITIEIGHLLWSGRIKVARDRSGFVDEPDQVICELEGDRAWLMKILAWPNFLLPIQVQFPPRGVAIGTAKSVIKWLIGTQTFRLQSGLWDLVNTIGSLDLDWRSWFSTFLMQDVTGDDGQFDISDIMRMLRTPIYVVPENPLTDTSPLVSINWKMDKLSDLIEQEIEDNGLVVEVNLWRPGDPQPSPNMLFPLTTPTIVVDVKDRMNIVGPTGLFFDGVFRTLVDLEDSIFGEILDPFLNPNGNPVPEGFNIAPAIGVDWIPPWVVFNADHPKSGVSVEVAHHHPLAFRTIIGGKSPKWMNDLMNAFFSYLLDMVMIVVGLTGVPSNLFDGLFNDVLFAYALADNFERRLKAGPYAYPEWIAPTGHSPYNFDGFFEMKRQQWLTRGYVSAITYFQNGYPYEVGRDLFPGAMATVVKRNKAYTDFVENIVITHDRSTLSVEVQIGDGKAEEPTSVKTYRKLTKAMEAINILTMSTQ